MQNNVTELTERLLKALDSEYNVINMHEVVDIISLLEKVAITKELLGTTRLGKHVNELRRKTNDQDLWRRAKELLKKWRSMVLPEANGQIKTPAQPQPPALRTATANKPSPPLPGQSLVPRVSPVPPKKVSPPVPTSRMVSPAPQNRLVSPGVQRLSPVSPQIQKKLVSPHGRMVSPGLHAHKLVSPHSKLVSPGLQAHQLVNPHKMVSPGGRKVSPKLAAQAQGQKVGGISPPLTAGQHADVNLNQLKNKKRSANEALDSGVNAKRSRLNGGVTDLDFSDSCSNSSFKDVISASADKPKTKREVIVINSDSNSSFPERIGDSLIDQLQPKKRGRKKGSKNHKNLLDEAETSFSNKLAASASRGGSKVKTTQEILAGIQNKNSVAALSAAAGLKPSKEDLEEKAAKLTERVSIIDRKLNANAHRNKNSQKKLSLSASKPNERVIESGSVINDKSLLSRLKEEEDGEDDEEIVVVDDADSVGSRTEESQETDAAGPPRDQEPAGIRSLSEKEALALLPPIDRSVLEEDYSEPPCTCRLKENKPSDFSIGEEEDEDNEPPPPFEIVEDPGCLARGYLSENYHVDDVSDFKILRLHEASISNVNGNWSLGTPRPESQKVDGLYMNVVPHIYERLDKDVRPFDSFKKYSVSEGGGKDSSNSVIKTEPEPSAPSVSDKVIKSEPQDPTVPTTDGSAQSDIRTGEQDVFREWYECVDRPSYNGDTLRILPYCIVD